MSESRRSALIVGGDATMAPALTADLRRRGWAVRATTRRPSRVGPDRPRVDLAALPPALAELGRHDVAILLAGVTSLRDCRADPEGTARINVEGIVRLTALLSHRVARFVFLSTNQVFDGTAPGRAAQDVPCPRSAYGRQKAETERRLEGLLGDRLCVLRLSKTLSRPLPLFDGWRRELGAGRSIAPYADMRLAPVPLDLAVEALARIAERGCGGIFQMSGSHDVSYADVAARLAGRMRLDPSRVRPRPTPRGSETGLGDEELPRHTTLDGARLATELALTPPDVWTTLDEVLGLAPERTPPGARLTRDA